MGFMDKMKDISSQAVSEAKTGLHRFKSDVVSEQRDEGAVVLPAEAESPVYEVVSHIDGKNAKVRLYVDRLEWERGRGISLGKVTAGMMTFGMSVAATGIKGGKDAYEMVPLKAITSVSNKKDGLLYHLVQVQAHSGEIAFRVSRDEAAQFRQEILDAMHALENQSFSVTAPIGTAPDFAVQLQQLASLRDSGILSDEEFAAKKAEILARM